MAFHQNKGSSDVPSNSLKDPKMGPRVKQQKNKRIERHSLICNTSNVQGCVRAPRQDQDDSQTKIQDEINPHN